MRILAIFFASCALSAMAPSKAYERLVEGNQRFIKEKSINPNQGVERRQKVAMGQEPFAVVVACADSRVAPEILFDQGVGDLFVVRVAGNVVGPYEIESILYAVKHLHSSAVIVMGHENCGAVDAVLQNQREDIPFIAQLIKPAVVKAQRNKRNQLQSAILFNAENMANFVTNYPGITELIEKKNVMVRAAYYDLDSGKVTFM